MTKNIAKLERLLVAEAEKSGIDIASIKLQVDAEIKEMP